MLMLLVFSLGTITSALQFTKPTPKQEVHRAEKADRKALEKMIKTSDRLSKGSFLD